MKPLYVGIEETWPLGEELRVYIHTHTQKDRHQRTTVTHRLSLLMSAKLKGTRNKMVGRIG